MLFCLLPHHPLFCVRGASPVCGLSPEWQTRIPAAHSEGGSRMCVPLSMFVDGGRWMNAGEGQYVPLFCSAYSDG